MPNQPYSSEENFSPSCSFSPAAEYAASSAGTVRRSWRSRILTGGTGQFIAGLAGALLGAAAALGGAAITADGARVTSIEQMQADRRKEDREKIATVYNAYLDSAVKYNIATDNYLRAVLLLSAKQGAESAKTSTSHSTSSAGGALLPLDEPTKALGRARDAAAAAFELSINNLAVYGSAAAWDIHKQLVPVLENPNSGPNVTIVLVDQRQFDKLIAEFRVVFCQGVAIEESTCSARASG